jgi:SAM-dependent methyltransferase
LKEFNSTTFGELYAEHYDARHNPLDTQTSIDLLAELIKGRKTLELAIGTGRRALPLAARDHDIHGLEVSPEMVTILREKQTDVDIPVTIGDMSDFALGLRFGFAFLVFNTIFNLTSKQAQLSCFQCTTDHLDDGGHFLVETFVPNFEDYKKHQELSVKDLQFGSVLLEAIKHDPVEQLLEYQRIHIDNKGTRLHPLAMRYAWPSEMDLMAKLAGLELDARWGDWDKSPFTAQSEMHVSLYRKVSAG